MVYTFINLRNDVKMFKSLVETRAVGELFFTAKLLNSVCDLLWAEENLKHTLNDYFLQTYFGHISTA